MNSPVPSMNNADSRLLARGRRLGFPFFWRANVREIFRFIVRLPAVAVLVSIRVYQRLFSPLLPALFGPTCGCRFAPSCSHYAAEAVQVHGAFRGTGLALRRLVRCAPWHAGGFDPVPRANRRRQCARVASTPVFHS